MRKSDLIAIVSQALTSMTHSPSRLLDVERYLEEAINREVKSEQVLGLCRYYSYVYMYISVIIKY